ncbi:MAG TPA: MEDS domain-containing protein [Actinoplanes sp.]|nr:MEDS domain-containing protein [Actinoplanes sp.]
MTDAVDTNAVAADTVDTGDHACLTFTDPEERWDLIAAFVRDGLRQGSKVLCWTDSITPDGLADQLKARSVRPGAALSRGQLHLAPVAESLTGAAGGAAAMVAVLAAELDIATRQGYRGLRVTADMSWATRPMAAAQELAAFESEVAELFADGRLCLVCQYDRERFDAVTLAFAAKAHPKTITAQVYHEHPLLRVCRQYSPPGIRVAGQIDYQHRHVLEQALTESLRLDRNPHVNLSGLDYIDGACANVIVAAAARLPASRHLTVTCRRRVAKVFDLLTAHTSPGLRVRLRP